MGKHNKSKGYNIWSSGIWWYLWPLLLIYAGFIQNIRTLSVLAIVYFLSYRLTKRKSYSAMLAIIVAITVEVLVNQYETWAAYRGLKDIRNNGNYLVNKPYPFLNGDSSVCPSIVDSTQCNEEQRCRWVGARAHHLGDVYNNKCINEDILMRDDDDQVETPLDLKCNWRFARGDCNDDERCVWDNDTKLCSQREQFQNDNDHVIEGFKGSPGKRRQRRKQRQRRQQRKKNRKNVLENYEDEDKLESSYIDLGSSFLEAYRSLTPKQIEKMSGDTQALMGHQKKLIETLDNLGPVIKGGKKIMEQFKHYFKDEM